MKEHLGKKYIIGIEVRTSNEEAAQTIPVLWSRFQKEGIFKRIEGKVSDDVFAIYTDYAGDYTQPYTFVIGCEVASLDNIPKGFVGKTIPASDYEVFLAKGIPAVAVYKTWQKIWNSPLKRSYKADFELYRPGFERMPIPEVPIYIGIQNGIS